MGNKVRIHLPKSLSELLETLPEQGMGYQIVDIILNNGKILTNKLVFNSSVLELEKSEEIEPKDISIIKLHSK